MGEAWLFAKGLKPFHARLPERLPVVRREVHGFVEVKAVIEPGVVSLGEGDDELTSPLVKSVHVDPGLL